MKRVVPPSLVDQEHQDFERIAALEDEIVRRIGGRGALERVVPAMLRDAIDDVMQTAKTGRRSWAELEKTEKTYIGTRVEIALRSLLGVPRRKLDLLLLGEDVDVKHTLGLNWMIPNEAIGHVCILIASDEAKAICFMGLFVARPEYLNAGFNQDRKRSLSSEGFQHVRWLLNACPLPPNFWRTLDQADVDAIAIGRTGNERSKELFRRVQRRPITRRVVEDTAAQKDFTRRVRSDASKGREGTRDELAHEGILLLSQQKHRQLIAALGLPALAKGEYISVTVTSAHEAELARAAGIPVTWPIS